jgi:hypothetical protein
MEIYKRKNNGGNQQMNPRSRSNSFPSQRGEIDWRKYRSRSLLSFFPQEDARIIGGIERKQSPKRTTMVEKNFL